MADDDDGAVTVERSGVELIEALQSTLQTRRNNFANRAGLQYGGNRDVFKVAGYPPAGNEKFEDYMSLYERGDIAGRIVDMFPKTTWKNPPTVFETDRENEETEFTQAFKTMAKRLNLWQRFERVDRLSRIGRYGVLLLGTPVENDRELKQPLETLSSPDELLYLSSFHEGHAEIDEWETDTGNERFGLPKIYSIDLSSGVPGFGSKKLPVHHSRVIHVAEDPLQDEVFGRPALKRVLNRLFDLEKISASTAEAYWQLADRILVASIDPNVSFKDDEQLEKFSDTIEELMHDLRRQIFGRGLDMEWLDSTPPDPSGPADFYLMLIAASGGYPKRVLFGTETGERASEQDERAYFGSVSERQEQHAEPNILRAFTTRMIELSALPEPGTKGYSVSWSPLFELTEEELAEANLRRAETAAALTPMGEDPTRLIETDDEGNLQVIKIDGPMFGSPIPPDDEGPPEAQEVVTDG